MSRFVANNVYLGPTKRAPDVAVLLRHSDSKRIADILRWPTKDFALNERLLAK